MVHDQPTHLGAVIRQHRLEQGLSLQELGQRAGVTKGYLSLLERGKRSTPSAKVLQRIATALGLPATALLGGDERSLERSDGADRASLAELPDELRPWLPKWLVEDIGNRSEKGLPVYPELLRFIAAREASGEPVTREQYQRVLGGAAARGLRRKEDLTLIEWADFFALVNEIQR